MGIALSVALVAVFLLRVVTLVRGGPKASEGVYALAVLVLLWLGIDRLLRYAPENLHASCLLAPWLCPEGQAFAELARFYDAGSGWLYFAGLVVAIEALSRTVASALKPATRPRAGMWRTELQLLAIGVALLLIPMGTLHAWLSTCASDYGSYAVCPSPVESVPRLMTAYTAPVRAMPGPNFRIAPNTQPLPFESPNLKWGGHLLYGEFVPANFGEFLKASLPWLVVAILAIWAVRLLRRDRSGEH